MDCDFFCDCAEFRRYSVHLPYPEVTITQPNKRYASIISGAYAGKGSESTAIAQYSVHRFFTQRYPDIFIAYKDIAFTEMIHFTLLGNLIGGLGLKPELISYETGQYWNGSFPARRSSIKETLDADIQGEKDAVAHYKRMIGRIDNNSIQKLFERIIMDEEMHIQILTELYGSL